MKKSLLAMCIVAATSHAAEYVVHDLGVLPGGKQSFAYSVNELDQVAGTSDGAVGAFAFHGYKATPVGGDPANGFDLIDVGHFGGNESYASHVSELGNVFGAAYEIPSVLGGATKAFKFDGVQLIDLGKPVESTRFSATRSNIDDTLLVGYGNKDIDTTGDDTPNDVTDDKNDRRQRAVVFDTVNNAFTFLGVLKDASNAAIEKSTTTARAINSSGVIVGYASPAADSSTLHPVRWNLATPDEVEDLGTLGLSGSAQANDVNDAGLIVGLAQDIDFGAVQPFVFDDSQSPKMKGLGQLRPEMKFGEAYGINNSNIIVGSSLYVTGSRQRTHAFVYHYDTSANASATSNKLRDLNDLIDCDPVNKWELIEARDINDNGTIVGHGTINGEVHAFMLKPTGDTTPALQCSEEEKDESGGSFPLWTFALGLLWPLRRRAK